jgi:hypothetical protein
MKHAVGHRLLSAKHHKPRAGLVTRIRLCCPFQHPEFHICAPVRVTFLVGGVSRRLPLILGAPTSGPSSHVLKLGPWTLYPCREPLCPLERRLVRSVWRRQIVSCLESNTGWFYVEMALIVVNRHPVHRTVLVPYAIRCSPLSLCVLDSRQELACRMRNGVPHYCRP